jgi:hypothetical protein
MSPADNIVNIVANSREYGYTCTFSPSWLFLLFAIQLISFPVFFFFFLNYCLVFLRTFIPSIQNVLISFDLLNNSCQQVVGSRDKFFVGHLLKWYYQEMVSNFSGKVNQSKAVPTTQSKRGEPRHVRNM